MSMYVVVYFAVNDFTAEKEQGIMCSRGKKHHQGRNLIKLT